MPYPEIYDGSGNKLAILDNITQDEIFRRINNRYTYNFIAHEKPLKSEYIQFDNVIKGDGNAFDIVYIDTSDNINNEILYEVECEHVFYRLIQEELDNYAFTGTPTQILNDLLTGTDFTTGTVDFTDSIVFAVNRNANKMNIIFSLANTLGGEIDFSDDGFTIDLLNSIGQDNGYEIRVGKNLQSIRKTVDKRGEDKTSYSFDMINIFQSEELIEKGLENLEKLEIGDTCRLIDTDINVDVTQSVLEERKSLVKEIKNRITTANNFDNITDEFAFLQEEAIKQGDIIYGVKINNDVGIEIERNDKLARTKLNADEFKMQTGDGNGNYTDALYFDPINERYVFVGQLEATDFIGGSIDIGNGTFSVDQNGNLIATSATISGAITITGGSGIGNLSDAGGLATKDNVDITNSSEVLNVGDLAILDVITETEITDSAVTTPKVATGAIITDKLATNSVVASKISVADLSAISADIGDITAGTITGITITGGTIRTSSSGTRIEISNDDLETYNSSNNLNGFQLDSAKDFASFDIYDDGAYIGSFSMTDLNGMQFNTFTDATNGNLLFNVSGDISLNPSPGNQALYNGDEIGTITSVDSGNGLDGGGATGSVTLDIDPSEIAGHGLDEDANQNLEVDETELDFSSESRSWFEDSYITRPYFGANYCYVDTDGTNVAFRDSAGNVVAII